eukprot:3025539-Amphidinium_carterae.1
MSGLGLGLACLQIIMMLANQLLTLLTLTLAGVIESSKELGITNTTMGLGQDECTTLTPTGAGNVERTKDSDVWSTDGLVSQRGFGAFWPCHS